MERRGHAVLRDVHHRTNGSSVHHVAVAGPLFWECGPDVFYFCMGIFAVAFLVFYWSRVTRGQSPAQTFFFFGENLGSDAMGVAVSFVHFFFFWRERGLLVTLLWCTLSGQLCGRVVFVGPCGWD